MVADTPRSADETAAVLVPTFGSLPERAVDVALAVADATGAPLRVLAVGERCEDAGAESADAGRETDGGSAQTARVRDGADGDGPGPEAELVDAVEARASGRDVAVSVTRFTGSSPVDGVVEAAETHGAGLVVVDEGSASGSGGPIRENAARRISEAAPCDAVVVSDNREPAAIASVLVPVADGDHADTAVAVAAAIARGADAWLELLHVVESEDERDRGEELLERHADAVDGVPVEQWLVEGESVTDVIVEQSEYYDLTVIGAPESNRLTRLVFGSVPSEVRDEAANAVVTARRGSYGFFGSGNRPE